MTLTRILSVLMISVMLFACSSKKKEEEKILPAEEIYNNSMNNLETKKYKKAVEGFEELERTYPYSKWAIKAKIMSAYTSYKNEEYTDAISTLDKFIALHPGNKDIEYAYYLKALSYYEQISDIGRDQSYSIYSRDALQEVIARFPESEYSRDSQIKLDLVLDHLAGKEVEVGRFYLKKGKYIAAINRFKEVIDKYQTTSHVPEALHRLVEANVSLGLKDEATKYASVLGYNYPGSKWYEYSYKLVEGKKPDVKSRESDTKKWSVNPFKKSQKNLADTVSKEVPEVENGNNDKIIPLKVEPVTNREVTESEIISSTEEVIITPKDSIFKKVSKWFKGLTTSAEPVVLEENK